MKVWAAALAVLLAAQPTAAQERVAPYIDPALRLLAQPEVRRAIERAPRLGTDVAAAAQPFAGRLALIRENAVVEPRVAAFVELRNQTGLSELRALGATIGSVANNIATVELPVAAIDRLSTITGVVAFEAAHTLSINHDSSTNAIRLNDVRRLVGGVWTGATGRGVIVGVYDTGLDFRHEDFREANGNTRVLAIWDQTRGGPPPPPGFLSGHLCTRDAIQRVIDNPADASPCPQQDTNGHGSHTAGTAAGDGSAVGNGGTPFQYAGVATNADLMIVKGGNGSFSEAGILEGLRWLEEQSRALNRPMVVNLSLGGQTGAHDGSRLYEQEIDRLSRSGFMVVISAGNDGSNGNLTPPSATPVFMHGTGNALTGATRDFTFLIPSYAQVAPRCNEFVRFSFWYKPQDRLRIALVRPDGSTLAVDPGQNVSQDNSLGYVVIDNASGPNGITPNPQNGDLEALVETSDCGTSGLGPTAGTWTLRITTIGTGSGQPFHFWMNQNFLGGGAQARGGTGFDNRFVVGSPGNARSAVTVGAFATRMCWPTTAGQVCFAQREEIGDLARFSSGGPTRDLRLKPEITAPGIGVVSALSANASAGSTNVMPDGVHRVNAGTSMAAPHVTGTIALMLEVDATLTSDEVKQIFSRTATRDGFTARRYSNEPGAVPAEWWGYGKLDVPTALCGVGGGGASFVRVNPASDSLPQNATVMIDVCAMGGTLVFESTDPNVATVDANGLVRALQFGTTLIIARAGTAADTAIITVVAPSTIVATGSSLAPTQPSTSAAGTVLPLLRLGLRVNGVEGVRIDSLAFVVSGADPGARMVVVQDLNRNGSLESSDRTVGSALRGPNDDTDTVVIATSGLTLAAREDVPLLIGLQLSGAAPNNTAFSISFVAPRTRTTGVRSLARDRIEAVTTPIASSVATTTVLAADEVFSLSENPVRSNRVVFNFRERPSLAGIYTLSGRRVRDLAATIDHAGQVIWNLENEDGTRVAPGIYLVVFNVSGQVMREKLFVLTPR